MRAILTLEHGDENSGLTIMDDGTKVYWTGGRGSYVTVIYPDGRVEELSDSKPHPILEALGDLGPGRAMKPAEELEYGLIRNRWRSE